MEKSAYVVVPSRPGWVELHVQLSFFSSQLVVLGLFLSGQGVPLETQKNIEIKNK